MKPMPRLLLLATLLVTTGLAQTMAQAVSQTSDRQSRQIEEERDRPQGRAALTDRGGKGSAPGPGRPDRKGRSSAVGRHRA